MNATPSPLADYEQRVSVLAQRAQSAREQVAKVRPSVTSADGAVTVTVSAAGALDDISFGDTAGDHSLHDLAALIKRTAQSARVRAAVQTQAALAELIGDSGPAMDFLRSQLPALREEDPAATSGDVAGATRSDYTEDDADGFVGRGA